MTIEQRRKMLSSKMYEGDGRVGDKTAGYGNNGGSRNTGNNNPNNKQPKQGAITSVLFCFYYQ